MPDKEQFDILIIGSGEAGKYLAWTMAKAGRRTAVVERRLIGGSCPNIACLPSKNIIHSAKVAELTRRAAEFGVATGPVSINMAGVRERKRQMVDGLINLHLDRYKASGAELILGEARFVAPTTVKVKTKDGAIRILSGDQVFVNVGTRAAIPDMPGLKAATPLTHVEALELDRVPEHLIVLGGGFVGLELAQALRRFGSRVTVLERGLQLAGREDGDVAEEILRLFREDGIEVLLSAELLEVEGLSGQGIKGRVRDPQGERAVEGSDLLVAVGRVPNT
jgi:pyruvate/2-oxoglutarate dehydrogenase complex dihydrolipoamide dehydrogenase (E3) component